MEKVYVLITKVAGYMSVVGVYKSRESAITEGLAGFYPEASLDIEECEALSTRLLDGMDNGFIIICKNLKGN